MNYDKIIAKHIDDEETNYGILFGNENIVFIKTGAEGDIYGYKDKYPKMAHRIHERIGATVICASNPDTESSHLDSDRAMISKIASELNLSGYKVYFVGTSDGGYHILSLAKCIPQTVRLLCINSSFIDVKTFNDKLIELSDIKKTFIYGSKDEDYALIVPHLKKLNCNNLEIITIDGADHQFKGMLEEFIGLIELL